MQKRSLPPHPRSAESPALFQQHHPSSAPKSGKSPAGGGSKSSEWGENFIMDRCGLPCVPSLKGRENVQYISLQHNLISRIDSLASFRMLKVLNLYDNKIERISGLDTLTSLRVLMLGKNRIKSTEGLESLQNLDILDLHGNQIAALTGVCRLKSLRVLNLAANSLKKLPSLDGLISLEELNAKRNRICKIAPEVALAKKLERLYLSNNELRRLDDLNALAQLSGLKELSLDGNPLTFNSHYVVFVVSSFSSLVLLDQNVVSPGLRQEAEDWSLCRRYNSSGDLVATKGSNNPLVTVQHKSNNGANQQMNGPVQLKGSANVKHKQRNVAVVRPMSVQHESSATAAQTIEVPPPTGGTTTIKSCLVKSDQVRSRRHKSFRQIAFSAMVCNGGGRPGRADDGPIFRFSVRPPTAEWNERGRRRRAGVRSSGGGASDFEDSSSSWNSDSEDSDGASSYVSLSSAPFKHQQATSSSGKPASSSASGRPAARVATAPASSGSSRAHSSLAKATKLSATIGMNIKEQLRDLRIIVGEEEVHISGINVIRMLHSMQWTPEEVDLFHSLVFHGLSFDQLTPYYASLRSLFPNLRSVAFRKVASPPTPRHLNALAAGLESSCWFRWISQLTVECLSSPAIEPTKNPWQPYAIYRLQPFGLEQIDGREIGAAEVSAAEDQYGVLDSLVMLTAPPAVIRRQLERVSSLEAGQSPSSSVSSSEGAGQAVPRDGDYALIMKKRAVRNIFQPNKEAKHLRNRSPHLQYVAEYGFEVAIKLSLLSQNWDRLLADMVRSAADQVRDEAAYKKERLAHFRATSKIPLAL